MILRLSSPVVRRVNLIVSLLLAAGLAYFSLRYAWAEHLGDAQDPAGLERATRLEPGNARHWHLLGRYWQYNLEQPDTVRAIAIYRRALALEPQAAGTWLDLAESYETEGQLQPANEAFLAARTNYPISADVAWRYGNFLLRQGELPAAFAEIRRSLTEEPGRTAEAVAVCWRAEPDIQAILDQALPVSTEVYLSAIEAFARQWETDPALAVWTRLATLQPKLEMKQASVLLDVLLAKQQVAEARRVWTQALEFSGTARPGDPAGSLIWDGSFEMEVGGGFGWRVHPVAGAQIDFDSETKHSGNRALRVRFDGKHNVNFENACQFVAVEPETSYRLSAWMRSKGVTSDQGVSLRVYVPGFPIYQPVVTAEVRGNEPWRQVSASWTAGKDVHLAQVCVLRNASRRLDNQIAGTVWVDDVTLTPESASGGAPAAASPAKAAKKEQP